MATWALQSPANRLAFFFNVRGRGLWQDGLAADDILLLSAQLRTDLIGLFWSEFGTLQPPRFPPLLPWWVGLSVLLAVAIALRAWSRGSKGPRFANIGILWVLSLAVLLGDALLPAGLAPVQLIAAGVPLVLLGAWAVGQVSPARPWILGVLAVLSAWTVANDYFRFALTTSVFDGPYQKAFDVSVEALIRSDAQQPVLVMNEAHEPAVRWRLIARGHRPRYRWVSEFVLLEEGPGIVADAPIYFASEREAQRILKRRPGILVGEGVGPYRFASSQIVSD